MLVGTFSVSRRDWLYWEGAEQLRLALTKELGDDPSTWSRSSEFFLEEYATDAFIAKMTTPVVTIMHGNTREPPSRKFQPRLQS